MRVLHIEDDLSQRKLLSTIVSTLPGWTIHGVSTVGEATSLAADDTPDLVILDLALPDTYGLDAVTRMHEHLPETPIVILTGSQREEFAERAFRAGAHDFLTKDDLRTGPGLESVLRNSVYRQRRFRAALEAERMQAAIDAESLMAARGAASADDSEASDESGGEDDDDRLREMYGPVLAATAAAFQLEPLEERGPDLYREVAERYGDVLDLAIEQRQFRTDFSLGDHLRVIGRDLARLGAGPRDVITIHTEAISGRLAAAPAPKRKLIVSEGRVVALELMGWLASGYRLRALMNNAPATERLSELGDSNDDANPPEGHTQ